MPLRDLPISTSITMRPVWRRRQMMRFYNVNHMPPVTDEERADAIRVLALPEAMLQEMPAVWAAAQQIFDEGGNR